MGGWVIVRIFSLFLCPLSMTPGYLSFLLQSLWGAWVTHKALRSATTVRGRSDWLRAQKRWVAILGVFSFDVIQAYPPHWGVPKTSSNY